MRPRTAQSLVVWVIAIWPRISYFNALSALSTGAGQAVEDEATTTQQRLHALECVGINESRLLAVVDFTFGSPIGRMANALATVVYVSDGEGPGGTLSIPICTLSRRDRSTSQSGG